MAHNPSNPTPPHPEKEPLRNTPPPDFKPMQGQSFQTFLWNRQDRTVLGRTGESWAKIGLFYVLFYLFLAGFFAFMMTIFYSTLDTHAGAKPKYTPGDGSILENPGLDIRPRSVDPNSKYPSITFDLRKANASTYHYRDELRKFLNSYQCKSGDCPDELGLECTEDKKWGYGTTSFCVILKLGKLLSWKPDTYMNSSALPEDAPEGLRSYMENLSPDLLNIGHVWVWCETDSTGVTIDYTPVAGFPAAAFPFVTDPAYLAPIMAARLNNIPVDVEVVVTCRAWAKNIKRDLRTQLGTKRFIVKVLSTENDEL